MHLAMRFTVTRLLLPLLFLCFNCTAAVNENHKFGDYDGIKEALSQVEVMEKIPEIYMERSGDDPSAKSSRAEFPCPDASVIEPCICTNDTEGILGSLDCTFVESEDQLAAVFQQDFPVKELYEFRMRNNSAVKTLNSFMNGITFESVYLYPGPFDLEAISEDFLLDLKDTVKEILIQDSRLTTEMFPFQILPSMTQLFLLHFIGSDMNGIPQIRAPQLSYFGVSNATVERLVDGTISVGTGGMSVIIDNNNINTIEPGSIFFADDESASSGENFYINLAGNQLQSLQAGTFDIGNSHFQLGISGNQIVSIEPGTFVLPNTPGDAGYGKLIIDLAFNQLQSLQAGTFPLGSDDLEVYLHSNSISSIEPGTFVLQDAGDASVGELYIDLARNQLQSLQAGTFPLRNSTVILNLNSNGISSIAPGTFQLPEAKDSLKLRLNLASNELTTIDEAVFGDLMPFIGILELYDNPLGCGCDLAWLILNTDYMGVVENSTSCADGTLLMNLDPQDFEDSCLV